MSIDIEKIGDQFKNLDPENIGNWPVLVRSLSVMVVCAAVLGAGYYLDTQAQQEELNRVVDEEAGLILDEMIDSMKSKERNEAAGYVYGLSSNQLDELHQEFPTNHPGVTFLERFAVVQYGTAE